MTQEKIMETGFKIMQNPALMAQLADAETPKDAFNLIEDQLDGVTYEDFVATAMALAPMIPQVPDEQLASMPNGALFQKIKSWIAQLTPQA